jgi:hypothetical protein
MATEAVRQTGIPTGADQAALEAAFTAHTAAVKEAIPADQLLVYEVKEGWAPLCSFLGVPVRSDPFPRTNDRSGFWDLIAGVS